MNSPELTLAAQDGEDLEVLSARMQDAVAQIKDLVWLPKSRRFVGLFNRFKWEGNGSRGENARIRSLLQFGSVISAKSHMLKRSNPEAVASLLAIRFTAGGPEDPAGIVELVFAGGGAIRIEVECLDVGLTDVSGPWAALGRPAHEIEEI